MSKFDEFETELERGDPWRPKDNPDHPRTLVLETVGLSQGQTKLGTADFLQGRDRHGKAWSVLLGAKTLRRPLIDGVIEAWNDEVESFVPVAELGPVVPGEMVGIRYDGQNTSAEGFEYPKYTVRRGNGNGNQSATDEIPF